MENFIIVAVIMFVHFMNESKDASSSPQKFGSHSGEGRERTAQPWQCMGLTAAPERRVHKINSAQKQASHDRQRQAQGMLGGDERAGPVKSIQRRDCNVTMWKEKDRLFCFVFPLSFSYLAGICR